MMASRPRKRYVTARRDEPLLFPPDLRDYVGKDHFARFVIDIVQKLDLHRLYAFYEDESKQATGRPPFDPQLMLCLVYYCICREAKTTREMEEFCGTDLGALYISGNHRPDHASFARFRARHRDEIEDLFAQLVLLCHARGLVKFDLAAIDSTVIVSSASERSKVKVDDLEDLWERARAKAADLLAKMDEAEAEEQERLATELKDVRNREERLKSALDFINQKQKPEPRSSSDSEESRTETAPTKEESDRERASVATIICQARESKELTKTELAKLAGCTRQRLSDFESGKRPVPVETARRLAQCLNLDLETLLSRRKPLSNKSGPPPAKYINTVEPECYTTFKPGKGFKQGYLAQATVDAENSIIIHAAVSPTNDDHPYVPLLLTECNALFGRLPKAVTADTGYASVENFDRCDKSDMELYCAVRAEAGKSVRTAHAYSKMRAKLDSAEGREIYDTRSVVVEPVFATIKGPMGITRFLTRGLKSVAAEWILVAACHNLLKMFRVTAK